MGGAGYIFTGEHDAEVMHNSATINLNMVEASRKNGQFLFSVANTVDYSSNKTSDPVGGIGLRNVKRRLELLYPEKHDLSIKENEGWFMVSLSLTL